MYSYKTFFDEGVLVTKFYGEYIADEGDKSLLDVCKAMTIDERYAIKTVIWDLQDVTAMSIIDTDGARVGHFEKALFNLFEHPGKDAAEHLQAVEIYHIQPDDRAVGDIFRERLKRVARATRKTPLIDGNDPRGLSELLQSLDLLKLQPLLAGEWQKGEPSAA